MNSDKKPWVSVKKELWKAKVPELMEKLQEKETEKMNMEIYLRMDGHLNNRTAYPPAAQKDVFKHGNLRSIKKQIACIKTILHLKMNFDGRTN